MILIAKSLPLKDVCIIFDFSNLVKTAVCFAKCLMASLNAVILTNQSSLC
jgi:hypothetical protein